jgi:amino acid adenylation domain-containing protein
LPAASSAPFRYHDATIATAFAEVAAGHIDRPAVLTPDRVLRYGELARAAGGVAARLRGTRPQPDPPAGRVGLLLDHGTDMVASILGSLAAGWCYVPLDPTYPVDRLRVMAAQAGVGVILTHRRHRDLAGAVATAPLPTARVVAVDDLTPAPLEVTDIDPARPAYVLFTSGSTGRPKGVTHSHRSVLHGITNHVDRLRIGPTDRTSLVTSFSYDMSVSDLYGAVLSGAAVVPVDLRTCGLAHLADTLSGRGVTIYHSSPTVYRYLVDYLRDPDTPVHRLPRVRIVLLGGEAATRDDLTAARTHFAPDCMFVNGYGATEATFTVQLRLPAGAAPPGDRQVLPIGTPLPGYEAVLLDRAGRPLPPEAPGPAQLAVRSRYHGLGYWGDPEQTAQRFSPDGSPDGTVGGTVYHTGDLVRRLPDGNLVYLGRGDRQVKVNGHRVELGEVEAHVAALDGVARAVAAARPGPDGATQVHAYVQPARTGRPDPARLRAELAARLPPYLLPHRLLVLDRLPLTTSGKVDVKALPAPAPAGPVPARAAPDGASETLVARAWCEVLGLGAVGRQVSFFDAGGTSLSLARLQYRLARLTGVEVPLVRLLEHPTVAAMARHLDGPRADSPLELAAGRMAQRRRARQRAHGRTATGGGAGAMVPEERAR